MKFTALHESQLVIHSSFIHSVRKHSISDSLSTVLCSARDEKQISLQRPQSVHITAVECYTKQNNEKGIISPLYWYKKDLTQLTNDSCNQTEDSSHVHFLALQRPSISLCHNSKHPGKGRPWEILSLHKIFVGHFSMPPSSDWGVSVRGKEFNQAPPTITRIRLPQQSCTNRS